MTNLFSKTYTIRFIINNQLTTTYYLYMQIKEFCDERFLTLYNLEVTDLISKSPNSNATIIKSSFVQIKGRKKDYELLKNFLYEFDKSNAIVIMTI